MVQTDTDEHQSFRASKGFKPVPVALASLSLSAIPQVVLLAGSKSLPLILMLLLVAVALSCVALAAISLDELVSTEVIVTADELSWNTLLSSRTVPWHQISATEMAAVDGSLATTSLDSGLRAVGISVTIMSSTPKQPEEQVLLMVGPASAASDIMRVVDAMKAARRQEKAGQPQRGRRIAKPITPTGEFRRRPPAAVQHQFQPNSMAG
jgi:hypothetical protein